MGKVCCWCRFGRCLAALEGEIGEGENRNADNVFASLHILRIPNLKRFQ